MKVKPLTLAVLGAALVPSLTYAIGLGDIILLSRVGESLRAEVPILAGPGDTPETLCFSLGPVRNAEFPAVTAAKTRIVQRGRNFRLQIIGSKPVYDPIFVVGLRAGCGADLQRDYILMPEPPLILAEAPEAVAPAPTPAPAAEPAPPRPAARRGEWQAQPGDTLASIAEARARPGERQRLLAAMKRANPDYAADEPLAAGTPVRIPRLKPRQAPQAKIEMPPAVATAPTAPAPAPTSEPIAAKPAPPTASPPSDRLVLGAAEESRTTQQKPSTTASIGEMQERMAQMETTLQMLRLEIEKMDAALLLAEKTAEAERKLRETQNAQLAAATASAQASSREASGGNWLELLFSALIGGGLAAGIANFLSRRRTAPQDSLMPPLHVPQSAPAASRVDSLLDTMTDSPDGAEAADAAEAAPGITTTPAGEISEDNSVLTLAEVMLSYGRLQGAIEMLAEHVRDHNPDNIQPWSMLLDLYRQGGMRTEFDALAKVVHDKFNVEPVNWGAGETPMPELQSLEAYPHIVEQVRAHWGTQACVDYLESLVHDTRDGQRHGFPIEVAEELMLLIQIQEDAYGIRRPLHF